MASRRPPPDSKAIDALYGLEPVFEPASAPEHGDVRAFAEIRCPACRESFSTMIDLTSGDRSYVEDCQICCKPMLVEIDVADGELRAVTTQRTG